MGRLLGSSNAVGDGGATAAPDAIWEFDDHLWVSWEAKSDAEPTSELGVKDVRQAGGHLRFHQNNVERAIPSGSIGVIVAPQERIHASSHAIAEQHLHLMRPTAVVEIYDRLLRGLRETRNRTSPDLTPAQVLQALQLHSAAPTQWLELLARTPLSNASAE